MTNTGCNHSKIGPMHSAAEEGRHCAFMQCQNYREKCPKHALARTGDECNLIPLPSLWLVEEHWPSLSSDWHGVFWDTTPQGAMNQANDSVPARSISGTEIEGLVFALFELQEIVEGYLWRATDSGPACVEVRKVDLAWQPTKS